MPGKKPVLLALIILILSVSACSPKPTQITPTPTLEPIPTQTPARLPLLDSEDLRVTVQEAKAALDRGTAVLVDVRSAEAFEVSHIAGAMHIPLGEIETNPAGLALDKDQWIITYCT
jgi:3-mercaptopyruvate sulfurtransferase SseA